MGAIPATVHAQWTENDGRPIPFAVPSQYQNLAEQQNMRDAKIGILLRFGYLAANPDASALRGRLIFDDQGRTVMEEMQDFEGNTDRVVQIEWGNGETMRKMTANRLRPDGKPQESFQWAWDDQARLSEFVTITGSANDVADLYAYNEEGKLKEHRTLVGGDTPGPYEKYTYDKLGRLESVSRFTFGNQLIEKVNYQFKGSQLLFRNYMDAEGKLIKAEEFGYDPKGRCISGKIAVTLGDGREIVLQRETWKYNERGDTLQHTLQIEGDPAPARDEYKYDVKGRRTEYKSFDPDGKLFTHYSYHYDSLGRGAGWEKHASTGKVDAKYLQRFDTKGRLVAIDRKSAESLQQESETLTFDGNGKPLEHKIFRNGEEFAVYWFVVEEK